jgi:PPOX class probable F420-dependent enzyme
MAVVAPSLSAIAADRLQRAPTVWLSSIRPDGRPHVVPVWFYWTGSDFDLFSKPTAQKVRNVQAHPEVMVAFGEPDEEWDVELVEGTAVVLHEATADVVTPGLFDKYAAAMTRAGLDRETYVRVYSQPVRITPTRFVGYGGKGWVDPKAAPASDEADVVGHAMPPPSGPSRSETETAAIAELRRAMRARRAATPIELLALEE